MRVDFEALLLVHVAPHLQARGYAYDARLRLDRELYGFRKDLGGDIRALVQFQCQQEAARHSFTVNLITAQARQIQPRMYGGYPEARGARLSYVMWYVNGLRDYPAPEYWWVVPDEAQLVAALAEALHYVERCGIAWLESASALKPWEMPLYHADEFDEAVQVVMARELEPLGYRLRRQSLNGQVPYCYFSKALSDGTQALIEMQSIYSLDPSEFNFDVRLQRRTDDDPLAYHGEDGQWRSLSLAQLVWQTRGGPPLDRLSVSDVKTLFWRYRNRAELEAQLQDVLDQIKQVGLAWIEQAPAESKMIQ